MSEKRLIDLMDENGCFEFYNSPAEDFYRGKITPIDRAPDFANKFKSDLLYCLVEFERVIEATFNSHLDLTNVELIKFKEMFPNVCKMFSLRDKEDLTKLGCVVMNYRNINAHSMPAMRDFDIFKIDYTFLKKEKVFNNQIKYLLNDNTLTVAGFVFIILNFVREESIKALTTKNKHVGYISCGKRTIDGGSQFVSEISNVNWEIKIRDDNFNTIDGSVFGSLLSSVKTITPGYYEWTFGEDDNYSIFLKTKISYDTIEVFNGSLTNTYYSNKYVLQIKDKNHFCELANQFPAFIFVDLLYKLGVTCFDLKTYKQIVGEKYDYYKKLMYPKFYSDKNIGILFASEKESDIRINSNVCNGALMAIFMRLEKSIVKFYKIDLKSFAFTRVQNLLTQIGFPEKELSIISVFRNLVLHGAIFNECLYKNNTIFQHSIDNSINCLMVLLEFFKKENQDVYKALQNDIANLFVNQTLTVKTKLYVRESINFIMTYPNQMDLTELKKKARFYDNSSLEPSKFAVLNKMTERNPQCTKVICEKFPTELMLINNDGGNDLLTILLDKTNYKIQEEYTDGVIRYVKIG